MSAPHKHEGVRTDPLPRFVRFRRLTARGFVEFSFGIGSRDLMMEMVLPLQAYREFCRDNHVFYLTREESLAQDVDQMKWRYGRPGVAE